MPGAEYDAKKHRITAAYGVVVDDGSVLLCRHAELRRSAWTAPGGFVHDADPRETVSAALRDGAGVAADVDDQPFLIWDGGMSDLASDGAADGLQPVRAAYRARVRGTVASNGGAAYEWFAVAELPEPRTRLVDVAMSALFAPAPEAGARRSRRG